MDLIKMLPDDIYATELFGAESIDGYETATWVERFQEPGEFKITAKVSSGLKNFLPVGTFISHVGSRELMVVENHLVKEPKDKDPSLEISGRSFVTYLDDRIIGQNHVAGGANTIVEYALVADETWEQIVSVINDHIILGFPIDGDDGLPGVAAGHFCVGTGTVEARVLKYGTVLDRVLELLKVDDVGLRILRPTAFNPSIRFNVYQGVDRTADVQFSTILADLDNLEYLFSRKRYKNHARVVGRWVQILTSVGTTVNVDRRYMIVDASDIDQQFSAMPTGGDLTNVINAMTTRGKEALKKQRSITITQASVSPNSSLEYRKDYGLGDLVMVNANFNQTQVMRVTEFAEIEDEQGTSGQPTLEIQGED